MLLRGYPIQIIIYMIPVFLVSITFHEFAHAFISYRLGDPTAKNSGRLTLNPLKHLDILGTIMIFIAGIGWAKPVPVNPIYYTDKRKGIFLTSIAGPLSNILLAFLFSMPMIITGQEYGYPIETFFNSTRYFFDSELSLVALIFNLSRLFYVTNITLAVFNLLPVPPLDGSKLLSVLLPQRQYFSLMKYENYIVIILLLIIFIFPGVLFAIMSPFIWFIENALKFITVFIYSLFI